ncbi:interferon gamma related [Trichomycterus rosablanca]|uniref:interferon gamma related n=1 Tax=Trichomycterus rosablanca TaxID=2290929 RepID=UPI002F35E7EC
MDLRFKLALMCGFVIVASLNGTAGHLNQNVTAAVQTLLTQNGFAGTEWVGKAVFTPYLGTTPETCTCERLMLLSMLNVYMDIFSDMLNSAKGTESSLRELQVSVKNLRTHKYKNEQDVLKQLHKINSVEVKDRTVQGGALNNFLSVFDMASRAKHLRKARTLFKDVKQR